MLYTVVADDTIVIIATIDLLHCRHRVNTNAQTDRIFDVRADAMVDGIGRRGY